MPDANDWNEKIIAEFRANDGRVGGHFEGAPMVLVHHRGRKSGRGYVNPMMYLPDDSDDDTIYVFATKAGAPTNPDWCSPTTSQPARPPSNEEPTPTGSPFANSAATSATASTTNRPRRYPGFADYALQTAGIRTIPVLELRRS